MMVGGRSSSLLVFVVTLIGLIKGQNDGVDEDGIFSGFKLFQARPESDRHREILTQMDENLPEDVIDFWSNTEGSKYIHHVKEIMFNFVILTLKSGFAYYFHSGVQPNFQVQVNNI